MPIKCSKIGLTHKINLIINIQRRARSVGQPRRFPKVKFGKMSLELSYENDY